MNKTAEEIFQESEAEDALVQLLGNAAARIQKIAPYESAKSGDMVFAPNQKALDLAVANGVSLIIIPKNLNGPEAQSLNGTAIITSSNIGVSHARLKQKYADHDYLQSGWDSVHPSAIVHPSVEIPEGTILGPNVVIEKGVRLGTGCELMANVLIEHDAILGNNIKIHPGTIIGWECHIGDDSLILSNSVIGGEGFGYAQDENFNHHRIPQTGNVVIGKRVTIGAINTIDRGTYGATTIGDGCIFDNQCHVAHNVQMGENCILLSGFLCAGSSVLGNRVVVSGGAMIKDHVEICDDTYLVHRAGVIKNISKAGMYAGSPVLPMKDYVKSNAIYAQLGALRQQVLDLTKALKELKKE